MKTQPHLDELGRLVGDPSRAAMLTALMDGRAWTGRELAVYAHITPSTASSHLGRLVRGSLVSAIAQGRHCYYRIATPAIAQALESLMVLAPVAAARHPAQRRIADDLAAARLCYDHLAGKLGVAIAESLVARSAIAITDATGIVTTEGHKLFARIGVSVQAPKSKALCRPCLDWSERRPHLAGAVGAALCAHSLGEGWVRRIRDTRAVAITPKGQRMFREVFGVEVG